MYIKLSERYGYVVFIECVVHHFYKVKFYLPVIFSCRPYSYDYLKAVLSLISKPYERRFRFIENQFVFVSIFVYNMLILCTVPEAEFVSTKSPALNGLENRIINPPARFDRLF